MWPTPSHVTATASPSAAAISVAWWPGVSGSWLVPTTTIGSATSTAVITGSGSASGMASHPHILTIWLKSAQKMAKWAALKSTNGPSSSGPSGAG